MKQYKVVLIIAWFLALVWFIQLDISDTGTITGRAFGMILAPALIYLVRECTWDMLIELGYIKKKARRESTRTSTKKYLSKSVYYSGDPYVK